MRKAQLARKLIDIDTLQPDVAISPAAPDIGFVHRRTENAEIYFLANTSNVRQSVKGTFRQSGMNPEWWDPISGTVTPAKVAGRTASGITVGLDLEPYGSRVLVLPIAGCPSVRRIPQHFNNLIWTTAGGFLLEIRGQLYR